MEILFEDNHLLVLDKPSGLLTQPTDLEKDSLETRAKAFLKKRDHKPGNVYLHALFRLDRPVSGVVLFAKTSKALSRLNESVRKKETKKIYRALLEGRPPEPKGTLHHFLLKTEFQTNVVDAKTEGAKECLLDYRTLEEMENQTLVEIELTTGRYHQIRAQFSAVGTPLLGDSKYGSQTPFKENSIALCHQEFHIPHPITKALLSFSSKQTLC